MEKYLSVPEFAKRLGITRIAVFKKIKKGILPALRIGKNWVIEEKLISEYFKLTSKKPTLKTKPKPDRSNQNQQTRYTQTNKEIENMGWD